MTDFSRSVLGIELGSTRIKAVLLDENRNPIASGGFNWENKLVNGIWTYSLEEVREGMRACYADLKRSVKEKYGVTLTKIGAAGVSGMMHGYLPFDGDRNQLALFRTWRNTMTAAESEELTNALGFHIPQRWSVCHLYQAMKAGEPHLKKLKYITTVAGYLHGLLTGENVIGIGEGSGMFPVDPETVDFDAKLIEKFDALAKPYGVFRTVKDVLPRVLSAGENAGYLTAEGAKLLDPEGDLLPGIPFAPPEGDAGTGMVATNSVRKYTGTLSVGTSIFMLAVLDRPIGVYPTVDVVMTPAGLPVALVQSNNCTTDINAWVNLIAEAAELAGAKIDRNELFTRLFRKALEGKPDCGGLVACGYYSGENVTGVTEGRPFVLRTPETQLDLADFMRAHLCSAVATFKIAYDDLVKNERLRIDKITAHGGFLKTPGVGQRILSAALDSEVSVLDTAGEGGPYGMALLAAYLLDKTNGESLPDYLDRAIFADAKETTLRASAEEVDGMNAYTARFQAALPVEKEAIRVLRR
ncbi:MAG: ATPase [Lachnospiraceae bacterium]|nr:ATPase [Lachnospiraceae bacterium]